jgi:uncharacterized protein (TIGR03437 family)
VINVRAVLLALIFAGVSHAQFVPGSQATINYFAPNRSASASATVSVRPAGAAAPVPAKVVDVTASTIRFVVPSSLPTGDAQLIYKIDGQATHWTRVSIAPENLTLLGRALNFDPYSVNGLATPAQTGQAVAIWGTGLGPTPPNTVQITLGGVPQTMLYAGDSPGLPGLTQFNFRIAPGTPDGCYVPLAVKYGTRSVTSYLSKTSDGAPCEHPFQLSVDAMRLLDRGGTLLTGEIQMSTAIEAAASDRASRQESAQAIFPALSASDIALFAGATATSSGLSCTAAGTGVSGALALDKPFAGTMTLRNTATTLTLPASIPQSGDSPLKDLPPPIISGGKWTWSAAPGSFDFVLPAPIQIAGGVPVTFDHTKSQTITWEPAGFDVNAILRLSLTEQKVPSPLVSCSVPAQAGAITIPANLLSRFDARSTGVLSITVSQSGPSRPHTQFQLANGDPLLMLVLWNSTDTRPVDFQ